ncbi:MAG: DUF951 domain-containing protein [bacterium]
MDKDSILQLKKKHPCGSDLWRVLELGIDVKIECLGCGRVVVFERDKIIKKIKRVLSYESFVGSSRPT